MGLARNLLKNLKETLVGKYGEKIVSSLADTSSDAPNRFAAPKRSKYDEMVEAGELGEKKADR